MGVGTIKQGQEKDQEFSVKSTCALEAEPEKMKAPRWKQGSLLPLFWGTLQKNPRKTQDRLPLKIQRETERSCRTCGGSLMPAQSLN